MLLAAGRLLDLDQAAQVQLADDESLLDGTSSERCRSSS
jgi:hypothetical protein